MKPRLILAITAAVAILTFAVVQDRVTAAGARHYVALQRSALAGQGSPVAIDSVVRPVVRQSVRQGLVWSTVVLVFGLALAAASGQRSTRE